jgi:tetratricopeptide (TPR) repeat protein
MTPRRRKPTSDAALEELRDVIANRPCALLIGAGSSIACGYPGWSAFIDRLADACAGRLHPDYLRDLQGQDYLIRADAYLQHLGEKAREVFREQFGGDMADRQMPEWLPLLFELSISLYLTTNYSAELETAARRQSSAHADDLTIARWFDSEKIGETLRNPRDRKSLIYLHGRWDDSPYLEIDSQGRRRSSIILGEHSYKYAYEHPGDVRSLLTTIARTHTVVVVGSSLTDQDMLSPFRMLSSIARTDSHPHFAVLPEPPARQIQQQTTLLHSRYSIRPVYYPPPATSPRNDIDARVKNLLAGLFAPTPRTKSSRQTSTKVPTGGEKPPKPRVVHPLHRAEDFESRSNYELALRRFLLRRKGGVLALSGIGGSGKTALVRELLDNIAGNKIKARLGGLFVWSFYEDPRARGFLASLAEYVSQRSADSFSNEQDAYEAFRSHCGEIGRLLIVMDGLERVQISRRDDRHIHGALTSTVLRRLLLWIAQQAGGVRAIVTTRFPLPELESEKADQRFIIHNVDSLARSEARSLLRRRGIHGTDRNLDLLLDRFGTHALTVSHLGGLVTNYLASDARRYRELGVRPLSNFSLGETAMRLGKLMATYRDYLEESEPLVHALLVRVAIFSQPVGQQLLKDVFLSERNREAPGAMAEMTAVDLQHALNRLVSLRFLYVAENHGELVYAPHPVIREILLEQLQDLRKGIAREARGVLEERIEHLVRKPGAFQMGPQTMDLLEELIYFCVDAGQTRHAFEIYSDRMGGYSRLSRAVDGVDRGERVLTYLIAAGELFINSVNFRRHVWLEIELALYLRARGRLREALALFAKYSSPDGWLGEPETLSLAALNATVAAYWRGDFTRARIEAEHALEGAIASGETNEQRDALAYGFVASISSGKIPRLDQLFAWCQEHGMTSRDLFAGGLRGFLYISILLRTGFVSEAVAMTESTVRHYTVEGQTKHHLRYKLLAAEGQRLTGRVNMALATIDSILVTVVRCGQEDIRLNTHLIHARCLAQAGRHEEAIIEIEEGRRLATSCEFDAIGTDLLLLQADMQLERGNRRQAEELSRKAAEYDSDTLPFWSRSDGRQHAVPNQIIDCIRQVHGYTHDENVPTESL